MKNNTRYQKEYGSARSGYMEGNTARKLNAANDVRRERQPYETPYPRRQEQNYPRTLQGITPASLLVLTMAIVATVFICIKYLQLQIQVQQLNDKMVSLEETLATMTNENDAAFEQVQKNYDLDYVYRVAVEDLGMRYPNKNKVVTYQQSDDGYVRRYGDIPE